MSSDANSSFEKSDCADPDSDNHSKLIIDPAVLLPTPNQLIGLLSKRVIGQNEAKRALSIAVYQHFLACAKSDLYGGRVETENHVMLIGPTGSGKSLMLHTLGEILRLPIFYIPCTTITPDGYKGKNLAQHIEGISEALVDEEKTKPGIVVWDEVDKLSLFSLGDSESVAHASVYRRMTQTEFLTYLDGTKCGSEGLDSSRILNIGIGAFVGLDGIRNIKAKPAVGFHHGHHDPAPVLEPLKPEHLIRYGLIPEFVGRFSRIACLELLDHASMRRILLEAENNVLARRKEFFALHGVKLRLSDAAIDELVTRALAHGTGARALRHEVDQVLRQIEHRLPDMAYSGIDTLLVDRDTITDGVPVRERKGGKKDLSTLLAIRRRAVGGKADDGRPGDPDDDLCFF